MPVSLFPITILGLVASAVVLVPALRAGRQAPAHKIPWIFALVGIGASILFRLTLTIGMIVQGAFIDLLPILIGNLAVGCVLVIAFWRPRWAGLLLIGTAVGLPLVNVILEVLMGSGLGSDSITFVMLGFYALPATITGILLVFSTWRRKLAS